MEKLKLSISYLSTLLTWSLNMWVYLSIYLWVYLSVCLSVYLSIYLSTYLYVIYRELLIYWYWYRYVWLYALYTCQVFVSLLFCELSFATWIMVFPLAPYYWMAIFKNDEKQARDVDLTCWCNLTTITSDSIFFDSRV